MSIEYFLTLFPRALIYDPLEFVFNYSRDIADNIFKVILWAASVITGWAFAFT